MDAICPNPAEGSLTAAPEEGSAISPSPAAQPNHPVTVILHALGQGERFLVCSHARPDLEAAGAWPAKMRLRR
jgi:hypothetical protein